MLKTLGSISLVLGSALAAQPQEPSPKTPRPPVVGPDVKTTPAPLLKEVAPGEFHTAEIGVVPAPRPIPPKPAANPTAHTVGQLFGNRAQVLFDQPTADGPLWFLGTNYKARFDAAGWTFAGQPAVATDEALPIGFRTRTVTIGGKALALDAGAPAHDGNRVEYRHSGFVEIVDLHLGHAEQSFRIDSLADRGEVRLEIGTTTDRLGEDRGEGVVFHGPADDVTYSEAVAIDANGNRVRAETVLQGGVISIVVPASFVATAALPLVIDPQVASNVVFNQPSVDVNSPDLAWDQGSQTWTVTFERVYSANDIDVFTQRLDADLAPIGGVSIIDLSFDVWALPKIANLRLYGKFLVVAQVSVDAPAPYWIAGRIVDNTGLLTTGQFDIERATVGGHAVGDKLRPDVGGDPLLFGPTYFTVVWERVLSPTDHDVHLKQVTEQGLLRSATPTMVDNATTFESNPSISRTDGPGVYTEQRFVVTYQRTFGANDEDIRAALLTWDGQFVAVGGADNYLVDYSSADDRVPQASTPTDGSGDGTRYTMFVYQRFENGNVDVAGAVGTTQGAILSFANLTALENDPGRLAWPQYNPGVDSDGTRFGVVYQEIYGGTGSDHDTRISLFGFDANSNTIVLQEGAVTMGYSGSPEFNPQIGSVYSSSGERSTRYAMAHETSFVTPFSIEVYSYDGYASGGLSTRPSSCGALAIHATGRPVIGQTVTFDLNNTHPLTGFVFGLAQPLAPIAPCPSCQLGVNGSALLANPLPFVIPGNVAFVGVNLAVQGFTFGGGPCLGQLSVSDTIDIVVQ